MKVFVTEPILNLCLLYNFSDPEDIEAYVKCVTTDIASEIKSEIREVIAKVDDVLDSTENSDNLSSLNLLTLHNISRYAMLNL